VPELPPVEEAWSKLEQLGIHVTENEHVVLIEHGLVIPRSQLVVELPCRYRRHRVLAGGFQGVLEPVAVVEDVQALV